MKKLLLLLLVAQYSFAAECDLGDFSIKQANLNNENKNTKLALIDNSVFSRKWLSKNAHYLISEKIPVLVKDISRSEIILLNKKYEGLLAGQVPKPITMLDLLCKQIGIDKYPAVVENGVIWQENPNIKR